MDAVGQRLEQFKDCLFDGGFRVAFDFRQARQLGFTLNDRDDRLLMLLTDDRIALPIAETLPIGHDSRARINAFAIRDLAAAVVLAIAFAAIFLAAEMSVEVAALALIGIDVLIDAFVAGGRLALDFERAADLFRRPVLLEQGINLLPSVRGNAGGIFFCLAARGGQVLGLFGAIATLAAIAFEFARNSARSTSKFAGDNKTARNRLLRKRKSGIVDLG